MQNPPLLIDNADALGRTLALEIADGIQDARDNGRRYVLGCPGGRTPRPVYNALAEVIAERGLELDHVVIAMMDEYAVDTADGFAAVESDLHNSCVRFGRIEILGVLNASAPASQIPAENLWVPSPAEPETYEARLTEAGGIDLFILATGESDGHVAFNPPGSAEESRTRVVKLPDTTRHDNLGTFPQFASIEEVPLYGVTVGIRTIAEQSRRMVMLILGEHKAVAFQRITAANGYDETWPATVVVLGTNSSIYADHLAAGTQQ